VVDGKEEGTYSDIGDPVFSPDSRRMTFAAQTGSKWFVVMNGKEGKSYDYIGAVKAFINAKLTWGIPPIFSPDSQRVAYLAMVGDKQVVVVDGQEEKPYDISGATAFGSPGNRAVVFSPDSRRVAYVATFGGKDVVVVDGKEGKPYDGILGKIVFDSANELHYLVQKNTAEGRSYDIYLVEETID
jgi:Tol biopolymer transport system component